MDVRNDVPGIQVNGKSVIHLVKSVGDYEEGYRGSDSFYIPAEVDTPEGPRNLVVKIRLSNHPATIRPDEVMWGYIISSGKKNYSNDRYNVRESIQLNVNALWGVGEEVK